MLHTWRKAISQLVIHNDEQIVDLANKYQRQQNLIVEQHSRIQALERELTGVRGEIANISKTTKPKIDTSFPFPRQ